MAGVLLQVPHQRFAGIRHLAHLSPYIFSLMLFILGKEDVEASYEQEYQCREAESG